MLSMSAEMTSSNGREVAARNAATPRARTGAVTPLIAALLPVLMILAAFVVNLAYVDLTRTELRISADAAARAAGRTLLSTGDAALAKSAAREAGNRNQVARAPLLLSDADIQIGRSTRTSLAQRYNFTPGGANPNAVSITARRDAGSLSGPISMIFPTFGGAGSFGPVQTAISSQVEVDIALVLDRSGSMAYGDLEDAAARASAGLGPAIAPPGWWFGDAAPVGSRWRDLVAAIDVFMDILADSPQNERLSLTTYSSSALQEVPLTETYSQVLDAMDVYTQSLPAGATNIHSGIVLGVDSLRDATYSRPWASKVVLVMTDGRHNTGSEPEYAAEEAFAEGITVFTVTFSGDADQPKMESVATLGGGKHFHAATTQDLEDAFRDIAKSLPTLLTH